MPKVVLTEPMHHGCTNAVLGEHPDVDVVALPSGVDAATVRNAITDADGIGVRILPLRRDDLEGCRTLKVIAKHGVGTDNIDRAFCEERGIAVLITPDANSVSVAEHAMMLMLALAKRLAFFDAETRRGHFHARNSDRGAFDLAGRTALVVGVGRTGQQLIPRLRAFGVRVIAADPMLDAATASALDCERVVDFRSALGEVDILSVHVPFTPETRHLIGARELGALKPGAMVINCARGGIVDEAALV
ncbi:MAG: NAD(P)-dependent oxidoreductase, partial [Pseudomonadota bacterium]